jgi:hypothetical protein
VEPRSEDAGSQGGSSSFHVGRMNLNCQIPFHDEILEDLDHDSGRSHRVSEVKVANLVWKMDAVSRCFSSSVR